MPFVKSYKLFPTEDGVPSRIHFGSQEFNFPEQLLKDDYPFTFYGNTGMPK